MQSIKEQVSAEQQVTCRHIDAAWVDAHGMHSGQKVHQALLLECKILRDELVAKKIACSKART